MSQFWNAHFFSGRAFRLAVAAASVLVGFCDAPAQVGISWGWARVRAPAWEAGYQTEVTRRRLPLFRNAVSFQLDRALPVGKRSFGLRPALGVTRATQVDPVADRFVLELLAMSSSVALQLRPFDLPRACDCQPLFPEGHWLRQGFQLWLAPGINTMRLQIRTTSDLFPSVRQSTWHTRPFAEAGVGLELALSGALKLMPFVRTRWHGTLVWEDLSVLFTEEEGADRYDRSSVLVSMFGLRAGLRW